MIALQRHSTTVPESRTVRGAWLPPFLAALLVGATACGDAPTAVAEDPPSPSMSVIGGNPFEGAIVLNRGTASEPYEGYCTFGGRLTHEVTMVRGPGSRGILKCHWPSFAASPADKARVQKGFPCFLDFFGLTTSQRSTFVLAANGSAHMTCLFPPMAPRLLTPPEGFSVRQNIVQRGCAPDPHRGGGYRIVFRWSNVLGAEAYEIFVHHETALNPVVNQVTTDNVFTHAPCVAFVVDRFLEGWRWRVRGIDEGGNPMPWSPWRGLSFEPCRLSDGTPCSAPAPS